MKYVVLKNPTKFTGKHLCRGLLINLKASPSSFIKKETAMHVFSVNFAKFLRIPFLQNSTRQLLLMGTNQISGIM